MQAIVVKNFTDEKRNRYYKKDDLYEHSDKKRIDLLIKEGYLKEIPKETKPKSAS